MKIMFYLIVVFIIFITVLAFAGAPAQTTDSTAKFNPLPPKEIIFNAVEQKKLELKRERRRLDSLNSITPKQKNELRKRIHYMKDLLKQKPKVVYMYNPGTNGNEYFIDSLDAHYLVAKSLSLPINL